MNSAETEEEMGALLFKYAPALFYHLGAAVGKYREFTGQNWNFEILHIR